MHWSGAAFKSKAPGDSQGSPNHTTTTTTGLLLHITVLMYTDLNHYNYIMEVEREIHGKYKAYTVSEKKAILEEIKISSTREVAKQYCMNEATI